MGKDRAGWEAVAYGENGWLLRWSDPAAFHAIRYAVVQSLNRDRPIGLVEAVPGFQTLHLHFARRVDRGEVCRLVDENATAGQAEGGAGRLHPIEVHYGGEDLEAMAREKGCSEEQIIELHTSTDFEVYFLGFAPGFAYLGPLPPELHHPRRAKPRTRVEPGSVAIGGVHTGIYPHASPGGWHVIGKTDVVPFVKEEAAEAEGGEQSAFLFQPGDRVRFQVAERERR